MVFRMGCRYEGTYRTPYGDMELAAWAGTISYEVLLAITARVPRVYLHA